MIGFYNLSLQGTSHIANETVCQDASGISVLSNGWIVVAVADGVGSAIHSDKGSSSAVESVIKYMHQYEFESWNESEICKALKEAYKSAHDEIIKIADSEGNSVRDYDTTLTSAIYNGEQVIYGHVGDGGIIILSNEGEYSQLTMVQKGDEFNCVEPLRNENSWKFGSSEENVCSFAMFTDGVYDLVCPWLLADKAQKVYVNYVRLFMDMNIINAQSEDDFVQLKKNAEKFMSSDFHENITDDKTIAVVVNTDIVPKLQSEEYYIEPEWDLLKKEKDKQLYNI